MKIQNLAVIFIIIILPISLILTAYVQNQVKTLELQMNYDFKLTQATYDAVKAFQLNTVNSSTSDLANSKLRDIKASVNTFFNSVATQFNLSGYNKDILKTYVPALVYTMYDGYYIYSPFTNTIQEEDNGSTYKNGGKISDLKPYIHYSVRYVKGGIDVVITYSLDNYITVKGLINGTAVNKAGYLLNNIDDNGNIIKYRGIEIPTEILTETNAKFSNDDGLTATGENTTYIYNKINGVKYYKDNNSDEWFSIINGTKYKQNTQYRNENNAGQLYYREAREFTDWINKNLSSLTSQDAIDEEGNKLAKNSNPKISSLFNNSDKIFELQRGDISIEDPNSNFNQHRSAVIRYSIEKNLSIAIANYNNYSNVTTNFQMPTLTEEDWEKILNNVSVISFLQGLSIGGKVYNGYSIVTNTKTEEVVNTDSIYIIADGEYHRATENGLKSKNIEKAFMNVDFERKSVTNNDKTSYFYPHWETGCYNSIVTQNDVNDLTDDKYKGSIYKYMQDQGGSLAQVYYTALGRERYTMYRTNNNVEEENKKFQKNE